MLVAPQGSRHLKFAGRSIGFVELKNLDDAGSYRIPQRGSIETMTQTIAVC